ncbi:MAG: hypothetical protein HW388_1425 [Dehalococcoidia bacterium]|nr:hypothetical protein [Dehalococcoidia bacterium]
MTLAALGQILLAFGIVFMVSGPYAHAKVDFPFKISGPVGFVLIVLGGFLWWLGS